MASTRQPRGDWLRREVDEFLAVEEELLGQAIDRDPRPPQEYGEVSASDLAELEAIWRDEGVSAGGP